jgi:hypothetical protein
MTKGRKKGGEREWICQGGTVGAKSGQNQQPTPGRRSNERRTWHQTIVIGVVLVVAKTGGRAAML